MNERELKSKINEIRTQISQDDRALKSVFKELKLHRTNTDELKEKRDELNSKVKELLQKARELKEKRDASNEKILLVDFAGIIAPVRTLDNYSPKLPSFSLPG